LLCLIAFGACALSFSASADERPEPSALASHDAPGLFADNEARAIGDEELEQLRGRLPAPMTLQQVGVVLWDEPRKGLPPQRGSQSPPPSGVTVGATILR
jgi:hypothetical protein